MDEAALPLWMEVVRALGAGLGPLLLFVSAVIAAVIAWKAYRQRKAADDLSYRQRKQADDRAEWWRRTQWAIDYASDRDDERTRIGIRALDYLMVSELATEEDIALVRGILDAVIEGSRARDYNGSTGQGKPPVSGPWWCPWKRRGK